MSEARREYADVPNMIRELRQLDSTSAAYRRLHEDIIALTLPLADHTARRFRGRGQSHDDLFQVASVGLVNAVKRFDPDSGSDFLAFAVPTIMGEVRRYFRDCGWAVKVPRRLKDLNGQLVRARAELTQTHGRAPTATEVAAHLGIDREEVVQATIASSNYSTLSTDSTTGPDGDFVALRETLGEPDARLDTVLDMETIRPLIEKLPPREQAVLKLRFFDEMTQTQIAERMGYSQMHVSRLLAKALGTLRSQAVNDGSAAELTATRRSQVA
ncbi:B/F/G family RNA polymerase sigma-70 factor [Mycobacterium sp. EPG1]|nr:B/F/G family RNA polymerase sigma-70 factor [Mycobacterium sp. EPG1]